MKEPVIVARLRKDFEYAKTKHTQNPGPINLPFGTLINHSELSELLEFIDALNPQDSEKEKEDAQV